MDSEYSLASMNLTGIGSPIHGLAHACGSVAIKFLLPPAARKMRCAPTKWKEVTQPIPWSRYPNPWQTGDPQRITIYIQGCGYPGSREGQGLVPAEVTIENVLPIHPRTGTYPRSRCQDTPPYPRLRCQGVDTKYDTDKAHTQTLEGSSVGREAQVEPWAPGESGITAENMFQGDREDMGCRIPCK